MTQEELLALKAVYYGCNTNRKLCPPGTTYTVFDEDMKVKEEIEFTKALEIVWGLITNQKGE